MKKKKTERQIINSIIIHGLRETIKVHGPISKRLIGSAAKRISGPLLKRKEKDEDESVRSDSQHKNRR